MADRIFERLDRFVGNEAFYQLFPHFQVSNLDWACSNHRLIELSLKPVARVMGSRSQQVGFKFNVQWIHHDECRKIISECGEWSG